MSAEKQVRPSLSWQDWRHRLVRTQQPSTMGRDVPMRFDIKNCKEATTLPCQTGTRKRNNKQKGNRKQKPQRRTIKIHRALVKKGKVGLLDLSGGRGQPKECGAKSGVVGDKAGSTRD